jgi:hypothetical protein
LVHGGAWPGVPDPIDIPLFRDSFIAVLQLKKSVSSYSRARCAFRRPKAQHPLRNIDLVIQIKEDSLFLEIGALRDRRSDTPWVHKTCGISDRTSRGATHPRLLLHHF